jgi:hypothetical protein
MQLRENELPMQMQIIAFEWNNFPFFSFYLSDAVI